MATSILTISGSFHAGSANRAALDTAGSPWRERGVELVDSVSLEGLAALNPARLDDVPPEVAAFRAQVEEADAVAIAAPEYAGGLAGAVKNATDWCVGSGGFYRKPVAVLSAGTTGGWHARVQLTRTLLWQGAHVVAELGIDAPKTKMDPSRRIAEPQTRAAIGRWAHALVDALGLTIEAREELTQALAARLDITSYPHQPG